MARISFQSILFDLDGVLIDSTSVLERIWRDWASQHGLENDELRSIALTTRTVEAVRRLAPHLDAVQQAYMLESAEATQLEGLRPVEGALELVSKLPSGNWAVVTSVQAETALAKLHAVGFPNPPVLVSGDQVMRGKPQPDGYLLASRMLGVQPAACLVIEDTPAGIRAALSAGMRVVALTTSHQPEQLGGALAVLPHLGAVQVSHDGVNPPFFLDFPE
jgi:mannitol-1-/sugar-/sorbitol-6-phosphatase